MKLCSTFPFWKLSDLSKWGFHSTAAVPSVSVHVHTGILWSCSVFNTPLPLPTPLCVAPAVHGRGASRALLWGQQWALGRAGTQQNWHRIRRSGVFFIKTALLLSAGFFEWRSCIWNLLEELLRVCSFSNKQPSLQYLLEERLEIECTFLLSRCKPPWFVSEENPYSLCFRIFG